MSMRYKLPSIITVLAAQACPICSGTALLSSCWRCVLLVPEVLVVFNCVESDVHGVKEREQSERADFQQRKGRKEGREGGRKEGTEREGE